MRKDQWAGLALALGLSAASCQNPPASEPASATSVPRRIVSLVPSVTELIYEVGAEKSLVGVTVNDTYPPQVLSLPKVGDQSIDPERLLSLKPDLVVLDTEFNTDAQKYRRLGLPVLELQSRRLTDVAANLRVLGRRLGQAESGDAAAERFERALSEVPKLDVQERVFIEIWGAPLMTVGSESLPDDLLLHLGLENAYSDQKGYFQVDPEDVVSRRPSVVVLPSARQNDTSAAAKLLAKAGVPVRVIVIDGDLFTNPSPRVLQGLSILKEELGKTAR